MEFPTSYNAILQLLDQADPVQYAGNRNFTNGSVTKLSPYIARGVLSTRQVLDAVIANGYTIHQSEKFIQQLAWREYFQRTWQWAGDDIFDDMRRSYKGIRTLQMPAAVANAQTGIQAVDDAIHQMKETGYLHNHLRMYIASIVCNIARCDWKEAAAWMYYHLLDGDLASNHLSWQWVAGHFSSKQYFCNQDNINNYTGTRQEGTFLDCSYEQFPLEHLPAVLEPVQAFSVASSLPVTSAPVINPALPLCLYNGYQLDPLWRKEEQANRVLLLEPSHFRQFPVSEHSIRFILSLVANIPGVQVFTGEVHEIPHLKEVPAIYAKEHPAFAHYPGQKDARDWLFPQVNGKFSSFFSYWKKCEPLLRKAEIPAKAMLRA